LEWFFAARLDSIVGIVVDLSDAYPALEFAI
jgi:hypothetical protein